MLVPQPVSLRTFEGYCLLPQELHVVAGIGLVDRGADDGAAIEAFHPRLGFLRRP